MMSSVHRRVRRLEPAAPSSIAGDCRRASISFVAAAAASLIGACSETASYSLCQEDCADAGSSSTGPSSGGAGTGGASSVSGRSGNSGASGEAGEASGGDTGAAGEPNAGATSAGGGSGATSAGGDGGAISAGGEGGAKEPGQPCDATLSPIDEPCLVSDAFAVFALASDSATEGDGSLAAPFSSLSPALLAAEDQGKQLVIACLGTFREPIQLSRAGGTKLRIFGGFECSAGKASYVALPTAIEAKSGTSLRLDGADDVELTDLEVRARHAEQAGESSIAALIADSTNVVLRRVKLSAGTARDGAPGQKTPDRATAAPEGNLGDALSGGAPQSACSCSGTVGGRGGDPGGVASSNGIGGEPALGAGSGGKGGSSCAAGAPGASPTVGKDGNNAATLGTLDGTVWQPAGGSAGGDGALGQGGGGGGGGPSGGGGSGGCGGCGGRGGAAGKGGGASIGLLLIDSEVRVIDSVIETGAAGAGGDGQPGQLGQPGGDGGLGSATGCRGGAGGAGSDGGAGGGGAGGFSAGVAYRGARPLIESDVGLWTIGAAGSGGAHGDGRSSALSGTSKALLEL